jgi:hypothetical protein
MAVASDARRQQVGAITSGPEAQALLDCRSGFLEGCLLQRCLRRIEMAKSGNVDAADGGGQDQKTDDQ